MRLRGLACDRCNPEGTTGRKTRAAQLEASQSHVRPSPPSSEPDSALMKSDFEELNDAALAAGAAEAPMPAWYVESRPATPALPGSWRTGLCSCFADCRTCCAVFCCHYVTLGQLWARVKGPTGACVKIVAATVALTIIPSLLALRDASVMTTPVALASMVGGGGGWLANALPLVPAPPSGMEKPGTPTLDAVGAVLSVVEVVLVAALVVRLRSAVRARDGIPESACAGYEDCCCAIWCSVRDASAEPPLSPHARAPQRATTARLSIPLSSTRGRPSQPCVTCQLLRHEALASGRYRLCSSAGEPARARPRAASTSAAENVAEAEAPSEADEVSQAEEPV